MVVNITTICEKKLDKNPRPNNLTSVCGEILECIIGDRVAESLGTNSLLLEPLDGLRHIRFFLTHLFDFFDEINKEEYAWYYVDAKAFPSRQMVDY